MLRKHDNINKTSTKRIRKHTPFLKETRAQLKKANVSPVQSKARPVPRQEDKASDRSGDAGSSDEPPPPDILTELLSERGKDAKPYHRLAEQPDSHKYDEETNDNRGYSARRYRRDSPVEHDASAQEENPALVRIANTALSTYRRGEELFPSAPRNFFEPSHDYSTSRLDRLFREIDEED